MQTGSVVFVVGQGTAHDYVLIKLGIDSPKTRVMFEIGIKDGALAFTFTCGAEIRVLYFPLSMTLRAVFAAPVRLARMGWVLS